MSVNCPGGTIYTVRAGDTFSAIARRFGRTVEQLRQANPQITDINNIRVGQPICIPGGAPPACPGFMYTIARGDTLFALARRFGTTVQAILNANPGLDPNRLTVMQEICIPVPAPAARRCVVMSPTDIAPNSEGVVYLNPARGRVFVMVTNVPRPEQLPDGEVYKVFFGLSRFRTIQAGTMREGLPGVWIANITPSFPVSDIQSVLVTSEKAASTGGPQGLGVATVIF